MKLNLINARQWLKLTLGRRQPVGDSQRRYVRIMQAVLAMFLGKGSALLVSLATVPLAVNYLGAERYGIWITISTMLTWLVVADLGLGNSLTNALSEAYGNDRLDLAQQYVATAFWLLTLVALVLGIVGTIIWFQIDWMALFNTQNAATQAEAVVAGGVSLLIFVLNFPFTLIAKIYGAYQEGAKASYWMAIGQVFSLVALVGVTQTKGGLVWLVVAFSGALLVVNVISAFWLFFKQKPWLRPSFRAFRREHIGKLIGVGTMFFIVQLAALLSFQTDNIIIATFLGAEAVTPYSVTWRLFTLTTLLQTFIFPALWPAYVEAISRKDISWIRNAFWLNMVLSVVTTGVLAAFIVVFGERIIELWVGSEAVPPSMLFLWMAVWSLISASMSVIACILNASGHVQGQMIYGIITGVVNVFLSIFLIGSYGLCGVIAASVIAYLGCNVIPACIETVFVFRKLFRESGSV